MIFALAAIAVASASSGSSYPIESVLNDARSSCGAVFVNHDLDKTLSADGWKVAHPQPGTWLSSELNSRWDSVGTPHREFTKIVDGRTVYLIFGTDPDERLTQTLCSYSDPEAALLSDSARILEWAGTEPVKSPFALPKLAGLDDVTFVKRWQPGLSEGSDETMIRYAKGFGLNYFAVSYEKGQ